MGISVCQALMYTLIIKEGKINALLARDLAITPPSEPKRLLSFADNEVLSEGTIMNKCMKCLFVKQRRKIQMKMRRLMKCQLG